MRDITHRPLLYLKAALLLAAGALAGAGLVFDDHATVVRVVLLGISIWGFCRAYYFAFYALHHYVDTSFRYTGLMSLARYALAKRC